MLLYKLGYITCFAIIAFIRFYIRFRFMIITMLYLLTSCFTPCVLFYQSSALILLYHAYFLLDVACYLSPTPVYLCS